MATPTDIPGFELHRPIGRGSFGEVWLATDTAMGVRRAVKLLSSDGDSPNADVPRSRQAVELEGVRQYRRVSADQPNLLQIMDVREAPGCSYLVMELADDLHCPSELPTEVGGGISGASGPGLPSGVLISSVEDYEPKSLAAVLERGEHRRLPPAEALDITRQLLEGLFVLHQRGLIHRDVKPANVLYVGGVVKLGDAGLVSAMDAARGHSGSIGYVPRDERPDQSRDLFAVGKLLYTMVTGWHPTQFPDLPSDLHLDGARVREFRAANRLMTKAAHPDSAKGFHSAGEMLRALNHWRRGPLWRRHPIFCLGAVLFAILAVTTSVRAITSLFRPSAIGLLDDHPYLLSCLARNQDIELRFSDGNTLVVNPAGGKVVSAATVDFTGDRRRLLVVGCDSSAPGIYAGALAAFDPSGFRSQQHEPQPQFLATICEDPPDVFQENSRGPCRADVLWAGDLDGNPGEELIVASSHYRGPAQLVVFTRGWKRLGEYWHFGWPLGSAPELAPVSVQVQGRRCIVFPMYGNQWPADSDRRIDDERCHAAMLILDDETLLRSVQPEGPTPFWSVNNWMNRSSDHPPAGYGYAVPGHDRYQDEEWKLRAMRHFAGTPTNILQLIFANGVELDLDSNLNVLDLRRSHPYPLDAPLPSPQETWKRTWPP